MSTQTDTPETEKQIDKEGVRWQNYVQVGADFARKLERERDDYRKQLQAELDVKELGFHMLRACLNLSETHTWEELAGEVAACRKERDESRTALSGRTVSCSQCNETANGLEAARVKLEFLASKGITVGILKSSDCPQGHLAYVIKPDSELCDLKHIHRVIDAESKLEAMRAAIETAFRRVDFAIINHNLDGETSLEHMKQARTQLLPFVMQ